MIATVGQLAVNRGIARLGALQTDGDGRAITRTYAANALGGIGGPAAVEALAATVGAPGAILRDKWRSRWTGSITTQCCRIC